MPLSLRVESVEESRSQPFGKNFNLTEGSVSIGRAKDNDIILTDPRVSSHHVEILCTTNGSSGARLHIKDLHSANGTYLEDHLLIAGENVELTDSQRITIVPYLLTAFLNDDQSATASHAAPETTTPRVSPKHVTDKFFEEAVAIKRRIHEELIERLDLRRLDVTAQSGAELRERASALVEQIIIDFRWEIPEGLEREKLIKGVLDEALGLGPLEEPLADENCSEIMVNSFDQIYAERGGRLALTEHRFSGEQAVLGAIERILAPIGRRIDESSPMVDARLKDGSRVNAVIRPLALKGPCITIRKFAKEPLTHHDLVRFGSVSKGMADFLKLAVQSRQNIVISGGTGSGKTTLLNVISGFIPDDERVITVEDAAELRLAQEHVLSFETRPANVEGKGAIAIRDLVRNALRKRPDRIIVGECRGGEALDMLQAMNTGHDGSMTTGHSNSPQDMISRLETMVLMSGMELPIRAVREQIASAVDIVVQQTRFSCGTRKVTAISEVLGMDYDEGTVLLQDVFTFRPEGYDENRNVVGYHQALGYVPSFFRKLQERGGEIDARVFDPDQKGEGQ